MRPSRSTSKSMETPARAGLPGDGTRQLLQWGGTTVGAGALAGALLLTALGGFTRQGATTNAGWFALIVALTCLPFGGLLLTLGVAKWIRNKIQGSGLRGQ